MDRERLDVVVGICPNSHIGGVDDDWDTWQGFAVACPEDYGWRGAGPPGSGTFPDGRLKAR